MPVVSSSSGLVYYYYVCKKQTVGFGLPSNKIGHLDLFRVKMILFPTTFRDVGLMKLNFTPGTFPNLFHIHELIATAPSSAPRLKSPIIQMSIFSTNGEIAFRWLFPSLDEMQSDMLLKWKQWHGWKDLTQSFLPFLFHLNLMCRLGCLHDCGCRRGGVG